MAGLQRPPRWYLVADLCGGVAMDWTDKIDPSTIPGAVLASERAKRNAGRRKTFGGGRPVTCSCGACVKCKRRVQQAKWREKRA